MPIEKNVLKEYYKKVKNYFNKYFNYSGPFNATEINGIINEIPTLLRTLILVANSNSAHAPEAMLYLLKLDLEYDSEEDNLRRNHFTRYISDSNRSLIEGINKEREYSQKRPIEFNILALYDKILQSANPEIIKKLNRKMERPIFFKNLKSYYRSQKQNNDENILLDFKDAIDKCNIQTFLFLLKLFPNLVFQHLPQQGKTIFEYAAETNPKFYDAYQKVYGAKFFNDFCQLGTKEQVKKLIAVGFDVNAKDSDGRYSLSTVAKASLHQDEIIPLLLRAGAKFIKKKSKTTNQYYIDTDIAQSRGFRKFLGKKIENFSLKGKNSFLQKVLTLQPELFADSLNDKEQNALHIAISALSNEMDNSSHVALIDTLLDIFSKDNKLLKSAIEKCDSSNSTPLQLACNSQLPAAEGIIHKLIENNANVSFMGKKFTNSAVNRKTIEALKNEFATALADHDEVIIAKFLSYHESWLTIPLNGQYENALMISEKNLNTLIFIIQNLKKNNRISALKYILSDSAYFDSSPLKIAIEQENFVAVDYLLKIENEYQLSNSIRYSKYIFLTKDKAIHSRLLKENISLSYCNINSPNKMSVAEHLISSDPDHISEIIAELNKNPNHELLKCEDKLIKLAKIIEEKYPSLKNESAYFYLKAYERLRSKAISPDNAKLINQLIIKLFPYKKFNPAIKNSLDKHENEILKLKNEILDSKNRSIRSQRFELLKEKATYDLFAQRALAALYLENKAPGIFNFNQHKKGIAILEQLASINDPYANFLLAKEKMIQHGSRIISAFAKIKDFITGSNALNDIKANYATSVLAAIDKAFDFIPYDEHGVAEKFINDCLQNKKLAFLHNEIQAKINAVKNTTARLVKKSANENDVPVRESSHSFVTAQEEAVYQKKIIALQQHPHLFVQAKEAERALATTTMLSKLASQANNPSSAASPTEITQKIVSKERTANSDATTPASTSVISSDTKMVDIQKLISESKVSGNSSLLYHQKTKGAAKNLEPASKKKRVPVLV